MGVICRLSGKLGLVPGGSPCPGKKLMSCSQSHFILRSKQPTRYYCHAWNLIRLLRHLVQCEGPHQRHGFNVIVPHTVSGVSPTGGGLRTPPRLQRILSPFLNCRQASAKVYKSFPRLCSNTPAVANSRRVFIAIHLFIVRELLIGLSRAVYIRYRKSDPPLRKLEK